MKVALLIFLAVGVFSSVMAQIPEGTAVSHGSVWSSYRETPQGKKLDYVITGSAGTNLDSRTILVNQFELKSFHDGDPKQIQIIAQAPQCELQVSSSASDKGPLQIFTPTTNLFVEGVGFLFTQSNHILIISNQVETRVVKSLLKSSILAPPRTNGAGTNVNQVLKIFANWGRFNLDSNTVDYAGNVHMVDPQLDMTSDLLTIHFTTNGAVKDILARQNVVLTTTNNGRATGESGFYYVTNGSNEIMQLTTDAHWRNGDEEAWANKFIYDSTRHLLTGIGHVRAQWPNVDATSPRHSTNSNALFAGANGFRKLSADFAALQFPPTNGPVEHMLARGNVIIVNQADQSRSMADQAVYDKAADRIDLTGDPVWWNDDMEVKAEKLWADLGGRTYYAQTDAHFKMRIGGAAGNHPAAASGRPANQWLFISSDDMVYQTNKAVFSNNVKCRLMETNSLRDKLNCDHLTVNLVSNQVESAFARGDVHGETAPDLSGNVKTIACERLNAYRSVKTGLMKTIDAHTDVVLEEMGTKPGAPRNTLTADTVTAQFSPVTNRIEHAVAEPNVVIDQVKLGGKTHATAKRAVYTAGAIDQVKLTGAPIAHTDQDLITDADFMIWLPKTNKFQAFGRYKIVPLKPVPAPKTL